MSLNPSNGIAARANPGKTMFRNLARNTSGRPEEELAEVFKEVDDQCAVELEAAGIKYVSSDGFRKVHGGGYQEVPTKHFGELPYWSFRRAWCYWVVQGPGINSDVAEEFHKEWGSQCRVNGDCGCPSPYEANHGYAIAMYHVDTQEGLKALADLIKSIYRP